MPCCTRPGPSSGDGFQLDQLLVMILGDFSGTLIVLYVFKALLMLPIKMDRYLLK
jgi:hypothetical protein